MSLFEPGKLNETLPIQSRHKVMWGLLAIFAAVLALVVVVYLMSDAGY